MHSNPQFIYKKQFHMQNILVVSLLKSLDLKKRSLYTYTILLVSKQNSQLHNVTDVRYYVQLQICNIYIYLYTHITCINARKLFTKITYTSITLFCVAIQLLSLLLYTYHIIYIYLYMYNNIVVHMRKTYTQNNIIYICVYRYIYILQIYNYTQYLTSVTLCNQLFYLLTKSIVYVYRDLFFKSNDFNRLTTKIFYI
eukprot:TRINITY_DN1237_c0_g1_i1.p3 TRINITY_DN1237_c0_g1~~TRINITY_DN1237_c0_g1_i1.p3  ORF type:complete len:197 (+),score=-30.51 TRINITY_DN1237_c0_g1_i1:1277-1867(+)